MSVNAFRIWNFMGFEDSDWIELKPINLLFGRNSTGKSALLRALLLLRQSLHSPPSGEPLTLFSEDGINAGSWQDILHRYPTEADKLSRQLDYSPHTVVFGFSCDVESTVLEFFVSEEQRSKAKALRQPIVPPENAWATLRLAYGREDTSQSIVLQSIEIYLPWMNPDLIEDDSTLLFEALWTEELGLWLFKSPVLEHRENRNFQINLWDQVADFGKAKGFLPRLSPFDNKEENENNLNKDNTEGYEQLLRSYQAKFEAITDKGKMNEDTTFSLLQEFQVSVETLLAKEPILDNREEYEAIRLLLKEFRRVITKFLTSIHYLGPVRSEPRRLYYVPRASARRARRRGTNTMENFLTSWGTPEWEEKKKAINDRLAELELGIEFEVRSLDNKDERESSIFEVILKEDEATTGSNLSDSGFGWSQMLPFVVRCVLAEEGATVIIEEPEAHLHPGAQAQLGNLFVKLARQDVRFLLETHSENLLLRLQRWVAETSSGRKALGNDDEYLEEEELGIYFINREEGVSTVESIEIGLYGELLDKPEGFEGFFSDDLREMVALSRARLG